MNTSLFELFKIGIGPSSSHTVGPMRAALRFVRELEHDGRLNATTAVKAELYGSLAHTGIGHGTDRAVLLGLSGEAPDAIDPATIEPRLRVIRENRTLELAGTRTISFVEAEQLIFHRSEMYPPGAVAATSHPNGMRFTAFNPVGETLSEKIFYSVGGGFILSAAELAPDPQEKAVSPRTVPFPFRSAAELLLIAEANSLTIAELILANESALLRLEDEDKATARIQRPGLTGSSGSTPEDQVKKSILIIWRAMQQCTERGIATEGILPGGLNVRRRAPRLFERIQALDAKAAAGKIMRDPLAPLDWVSLFAIATNEENAAGGRVVTAPTNGAAGVIPAIAHYYMQFIETDKSADEKQQGLIRFFLTARRHWHSL